MPGLGDLNYGYGMNDPWMYGGWDFPVQDYYNWAPDIQNMIAQSSLSASDLGSTAAPVTTAQIMEDTSGFRPSHNLGTTLDVDPSDSIRPLLTDISLGDFKPIGRVDPDGAIDTSGFARTTNVFGGPLSATSGGAGGLQRLLNAIGGGGGRAPGVGDGDGGGGGSPTIGIGLPGGGAPSAANIPPLNTRPSPPTPAPVPFSPMNTQTDLSAVMRLASGAAPREAPDRNYLPETSRETGLARLLKALA